MLTVDKWIKSKLCAKMNMDKHKFSKCTPEALNRLVKVLKRAQI